MVKGENKDNNITDRQKEAIKNLCKVLGIRIIMPKSKHIGCTIIQGLINRVQEKIENDRSYDPELEDAFACCHSDFGFD